ncbi:hypothetical protein NZK35_14290 [Stieleria sp. ICT_E10.1]|uniref:hypothetical protein n=1 Tax=Stieleria sedimenti TaxID=2976331 RepID=UPI00217FF08E|nr:hypothetical protein [Stieleria sedimenti]MCS7467818.1 hypothetical protein [Stieleria sedimenti]
MNASDCHCPACGHPNSFFRLWCDGCHAPLPHHAFEPTPVDVIEKESNRKQLYGRVLADLEQLARSCEVPGDQAETIHAFYRNQLDELEHRNAERSETAAIDKLICGAKVAAQEGRYQQAIESLQSLERQHPGVVPTESMLREIHAKEVEERIEREVDRLVASARVCLRRGQVDEAQQQLSRAVELRPDSEAVQQGLVAVQTRRAAESVEPTVGPTESLEQNAANQNAANQNAANQAHEPPVDQQVAVRDAATAGASADEAPPVVQPTDPRGNPMPSERPAPAARRFAVEDEEVPSATQRLIDSASQWSAVLKPFLLDNVGWFVGAFLVIAGFVVLIVSFWGNIEQNQVLMHSLVYLSLATTTGMFFAMAYFMRLKYPQLESSSNVLLVIVALLIPLVFAAAVLTTLVPGATGDVIIQAGMR